MTGSRTSSLSSLLLGAVLFTWMSAGETSNPRLTARELPHDLLAACAPAACAAEEFHANWVGRTQRGNLFVVSHGCSAPVGCSHWLIEKDDGAARALLELNGAFHFHRVAGRYPTIELDTHTHANPLLRLRYEWNGSAYTRTLAQRVYEVGGVECGTRDECRASATRALKTDDVDRAQQIWQQVDGVAWI